MASRRTERKQPAKNGSAYQEVVANFVPCGRCSFFLAGCRVLYGLDHLEHVAEASNGEWLGLEWRPEMGDLLQKSYGSKMEVAHFYFDSRCPECQRRFVCEGNEETESLEQVRIELKQ